MYYAIDCVLKNEGGFVNNPNDSGGATNFGISLRFYKMEVDKNATIETIKTLKEKDAIEIYRRCFWKRFKCDKLPANVAVKYFDISVNCGNFIAVKCLQNSLWAMKINVVVDGLLGPKTFEAIENACIKDEKTLLACMRCEQACYYKLVVAKNKTQEVFLKGWLKRAYM